jgi:hypothetical protein
MFFANLVVTMDVRLSTTSLAIFRLKLYGRRDSWLGYRAESCTAISCSRHLGADITERITTLKVYNMKDTMGQDLTI